MEYNVIVVGAGHYVTGERDISDDSVTDKDFGVLLPTLSLMQSAGKIRRIMLVARNGDKLHSSYKRWINKFVGLGFSNPNVDLYPSVGTINENEYELVIQENKNKNTLVFVAVPDDLHFKVLESARENDMHAFIVKPLVSKIEEYNALVELNKKAEFKRITYVDYHKLFDPQNQLLRGEINAGLYGDVHFVYSIQTQKRMMKDVYSEARDRNNRFNVNHYLGSHYIHQTSYLMGAKPINVSASGQHSSLMGRKVRLCDYNFIEVNVLWETASGSRFNSTHVSGWSDPNSQAMMTRQRYNLYGSAGSAELNQDERGYVSRSDLRGTVVPNPHFFSVYDDRLYDNQNYFSSYGMKSIAHFIELCISFDGGRVSYDQLVVHPNILESSRDVTTILECADLSLASNSSIIMC